MFGNLPTSQLIDEYFSHKIHSFQDIQIGPLPTGEITTKIQTMKCYNKSGLSYSELLKNEP